ncbi:MAG: hypothetical protein LBN95_14035 [Prevotellaceae bacterium]|jgi:hypothetical protein|nr:hypothetical protein [Prevotellaceae bacterium]
MTKVNFLRNAAIVFACLAVTMFSSCSGLVIPPDDDEDDNNNNNTEEQGDFTKRTFANAQEIIDFTPAGIYYHNLDGTEKFNFAKGADGSLVYQGSVNSGNEWFVLTAGNVKYRLLKDIAYGGDGNWYARVRNYPAEKTSCYPYFSMGTADIGDDLGIEEIPLYVSQWVQGFGLQFITDNICETKPVAVSNENLWGFECKKYTYGTASEGMHEYWVLDNGFCLKRRMYIELPGSEPIDQIYGFYRIDREAQSHNQILQKLQPAIAPVENVAVTQISKWQKTWFHDYYPAAYDSHYSMLVVPYSKPIAAMTVAYSFEGNWLTPQKITQFHILLENATQQDVDEYIATLMATVPHLTQIETSNIDGYFYWNASNDCLTSDWNCPELGETTYGIQYKIFGIPANTGADVPNIEEHRYFINIILWKNITV